MQQIETQKSPVLEAVQLELDSLPEPKVGDRNVCHFLASDGTLIVKAATWIDSTTGEQIADDPEWTRFFQQTPTVARANFVANMPDAATAPAWDYRAKNCRNPLTGQVSKRLVPWKDPERNAIVFENYVPGVEVSNGRKLYPKDNPTEEIDDPTDPENIRFFDWDEINYRVISGIFRPIVYPGQGFSKFEKSVGIIGINLGGTLMMEHQEGGLVPKGQIAAKFETHLEEQFFPECACRSIVFPLSKTSEDEEGAYGLDSSQIEIDFIADMAIAMTCAWNKLDQAERKKFAGFVISIGTDTCVDAMTILKTMLGPNCPFSVIAAGAMKPMEDEDSDGLDNFKGAFDDLLILKKRGLTTIGLRVEGGLYDPAKTRKISDKLRSSFQGEKLIDSAKNETAETVDEKKFHKTKEEDFSKPYTSAVPFRGVDEVNFIKSTISKDPFRLEMDVKNSDTKAILVEAYPSFTQAMKDLAAIVRGSNGRPMFYVNQVLGGSIDQEYKVARELIARGVYPLNMTAECARAKLNLAVRLFGNNQNKIIDFMYKSEDAEGIEDLRNMVQKRADVVLGSGI